MIYPMSDRVKDVIVFCAGIFVGNKLDKIIQLHDYAIEILKTKYSPTELLLLDAFRVAHVCCVAGTFGLLANIIFKCYDHMFPSDSSGHSFSFFSR